MWSMPTTLGCSSFNSSLRKKLNSGSGIGGISSEVVMQLYSRSTTTTYKLRNFNGKIYGKPMKIARKIFNYVTRKKELYLNVPTRSIFRFHFAIIN